MIICIHCLHSQSLEGECHIALQHIQLRSRVLDARGVKLRLCLVSCYKKKHVMGERGERAGGVVEKWEREREGETTGGSSSGLTTWGKLRQGHWSHTEHTSPVLRNFTGFADAESSVLPEWTTLTPI